MSKTLADGTEVPKPLNQEVHSYGFHKASLGYNVRATVVEMAFPTFTMLSASIAPDDGTWESVIAEYLGGIVALRISEGLLLDNLTSRSAVLRRPA